MMRRRAFISLVGGAAVAVPKQESAETKYMSESMMSQAACCALCLVDTAVLWSVNRPVCFNAHN
jgi:hypothetical protein